MSDFLDLNVTKKISKYDSFYSGLNASFVAPSEDSNGSLSAKRASQEAGKQHSSNQNIAIRKQ